MAATASKTVSSRVARQIEWLRADSITMHPDYQRGLNVAWAKKLAATFDPELLLPIIVSRRANGVLACMGGQHRLHALVEILGWGAELVECDVYTGLSIEQEARFHDATARTKPHTPLERFNLRVQGGEETALSIVKAVESVGLAIATNLGNTKGTIRAIGAVETMANDGGLDHLAAVLAMLRDSYGDSPETFRSPMLLGMSSFLVRYGTHGDFNRSQFAARLAEKGMHALDQRANLMREAAGASSTGGAYSFWGKAMRVFYNAGRRTRALPEWVENVSLPLAEQRKTMASIEQGKIHGFGNPEHRQAVIELKRTRRGK